MKNLKFKSIVVFLIFFTQCNLAYSKLSKDILIALKEKLSLLQEQLNSNSEKKPSTSTIKLPQGSKKWEEQFKILYDNSEKTLAKMKKMEKDLIGYALEKKDLDFDTYLQKKLNNFTKLYALIITGMKQLFAMSSQREPSKKISLVLSTVYEIGSSKNWMIYLKNHYKKFEQSKPFISLLEKTQEFKEESMSLYYSFAKKNVNVFKK